MDNATAMLQWGHALPGVETTITTGLPTVAELLQWGHALPGVETASGSDDTTAANALQWGHALPGVETADFQAFSIHGSQKIQ